MSFNPQEFFDRWVEAVRQADIGSIERMLHPDFVSDYPQSGERVRGFSQLKAQLESYPGGLTGDTTDLTHARIVDDYERWALTPAYTVIPLSQPDRYTTVVRSKYPDGSWWWIVTVVQIRDELIYRAESYFAPEMSGPLMDVIGQGVPG